MTKIVGLILGQSRRLDMGQTPNIPVLGGEIVNRRLSMGVNHVFGASGFGAHYVKGCKSKIRKISKIPAF